MYGFHRIKQASVLQAYHHDIFREGNEKNFRTICKKIKTRAFVAAKEDFKRERRSFIAKVEGEGCLEQEEQTILFDLVFYKDQIHKSIQLISKSLKQLNIEVCSSRSPQVLQVIQNISLSCLLKHKDAKNVDKLIEGHLVANSSL